MRLKKRIGKQQLGVVRRELCGSERDCCETKRSHSLYWNKTWNLLYRDFVGEYSVLGGEQFFKEKWFENFEKLRLNFFLTGLLILRDGAISHNRPQIASDRIIHE